MSAYAYDQYQKTTVETMSPGKLLLMLYDGMIKYLRNAGEAINNQNISAAHENIVAAQNILVELMATLNMDYKISESLLALYEFMYNQLVEANIKKDGQLITEVQELVIDLRQTWDQAIKSLGKTSSSQNSALKAVNISG
ncbi:MAG TPA: flagellar export chaperone FliS [Syntrophomonas sp.]|nr:flagellar export chaperone FliS [Syntrophomonas sp.]